MIEIPFLVWRSTPGVVELEDVHGAADMVALAHGYDRARTWKMIGDKLIVDPIDGAERRAVRCVAVITPTPPPKRKRTRK